jgi:hypothetical protein
MRLTTNIFIEEHIGNYNGHLLSNLSGTPVIPANSDVPIPSNFTYTLLLGTDQPNCTAGRVYSDNRVHTCGGFPFSSTAYNFSSGIFLAGGDSWGFAGYTNKYCNDAPYYTLGPEDEGKCKAFNTWSFGLSVRPLWNAVWE